MLFIKNLAAIIFLLFLSPFGVLGQQNHVPNGSFEGYSGCPTFGPTFVYVNSWTADSFGTPDYFHTCGTVGVAGVPANTRGFQPAAHGNAYIGVYSYGSGFPPAFSNLNELIHAKIIPLQSGIKYEVSMSVCRSEFNAWATNGLGVFFYDTGFSLYTSKQLITSVQPQVSYADYGPIADTLNWTRLTKVFIADSAYDNIVVGALRPDSLVVVDSLPTHTNTYTSTRFSYYFIDSLVVRAYDTFYINNTDSLSCVGDSITIMYETHHMANTIVVQLSGPNGDFTNPYNIDTSSINSSGKLRVRLPNYLPNGSGYRVRLITTSPADTTSNVSAPITIGNIDSSSVNINITSSLCSGESIRFNASTSVTPTNYNWTGPNGFNSTSAAPSINGGSSVHNGNYYVTAKFYGCEVTDTLSVTVKPTPIKPIANSNAPLCAGETLNLAAASTTTAVTYSWAGPNSFATTTQNPTIVNATTGMSGDYIVTALLNGCNTRDTTTVLVKPLPTAVTLSNNGPLCAGDTLHLNATASSTGAAYLWTGTSGVISATKDAVIANASAIASGWYKMTVDLNGCIYRDSTLAIINSIPATPTPSYNNPLCVGETLTLNATNTSGATYSWTGIGGYTANTQNPTRANMQFGDTGLYNVTATVNGCTSPAGQVRVGINPTPFVVILANPADSICAGNPVVFTALPNNHGGAPMYQWYVNNAAVSTGSVFNTTALANGDVVRCDMTESTKCSIPYTDASNDINMNILTWLAPSVSFTANPNRPLEVNEYVTFTATSTNAGASPTYQWKRNGQNVQGATGAVWSANTLNDNDSISVEVVSNYKCPQPLTALAIGVRVKVLSGIGDVVNNNSIKVYPNPVKGTLRITSTTTIETITINNLLGQQLMQQTAKGNMAEVDMSGLAAGVYVVKVNGMYAVRIVKE